MNLAMLFVGPGWQFLLAVACLIATAGWAREMFRNARLEWELLVMEELLTEERRKPKE